MRPIDCVAHVVNAACETLAKPWASHVWIHAWTRLNQCLELCFKLLDVLFQSMSKS